MAYADLKESYDFIRREQPILGRVSLLLAGINLIFSALIIIGLPIVINEHLGFSQTVGNRLYGFAEGALAAGGLIGGVLAGVIGQKLTIQKSYTIIGLCTFTLFPIGLALLLPISTMTTYVIIVVSCTAMMALSTVFSIEMITYAQQITPTHLLGKVMALLTCLVMCAHPIGQLMYGMLFEIMSTNISLIFFAALLVCIGITVLGRKIISAIPVLTGES